MRISECGNGRKRLTNRDERDKRDDFLCALYGEENLSRKDAKLQREAKERETQSISLAVLTESVVGLSP